VLGGDEPFIAPVLAAVKPFVYEPQLVDGKPSVVTTPTELSLRPSALARRETFVNAGQRLHRGFPFSALALMYGAFAALFLRKNGTADRRHVVGTE
jgi:hypothetical protein